MLILFVLGVMLLVVALLFAMFSTYLPFMERFGDSVDYNTAYYGALSAVERGSLALRHRGPGFDGESGWFFSGGSSINVGSDLDSDRWLPDFYTYGKKENSLYWKIRSRTTTIPILGEGNIEKGFITGDSRDFNALKYSTTELLPLGVDDSPSGSYYDLGNNKFNIEIDGDLVLNGRFRLNPYLYDVFSSAPLCFDNDGYCNCTAGGLCDLPVVSRTIKGEYDDNQFTLLPREMIKYRVNYSPEVLETDTILRKKNVNTANPITPTIALGENTNIHRGGIDSQVQLNVISEKESEIRALGSPVTYQELLSDTNTKNNVLSLSLVNFLISRSKELYPFLEYRFESNVPISDRFFKLEGYGQMGAYNVKILVKKPTLTQSTLGNFTIIF